MNLEEKIISIIKDSLERDVEINVNSGLIEDLNIDSIERLMIISALEDEFSITISDDEFTDIKTVKDIVAKFQ